MKRSHFSSGAPRGGPSVRMARRRVARSGGPASPGVSTPGAGEASSAADAPASPDVPVAVPVAPAGDAPAAPATVTRPAGIGPSPDGVRVPRYLPPRRGIATLANAFFGPDSGVDLDLPARADDCITPETAGC